MDICAFWALSLWLRTGACSHDREVDLESHSPAVYNTLECMLYYHGAVSIHTSVKLK